MGESGCVNMRLPLTPRPPLPKIKTKGIFGRGGEMIDLFPLS